MGKIPGTPEQLAVRRKWYDALVSGKYEQGTGVLRSKNETFCCLGVLCDLVEPASWVTGPLGEVFYMDDTTSLPPARMLDAIGMDYDMMHKFITLNDNRRLSFKQIAEYFAERYEIGDPV